MRSIINNTPLYVRTRAHDDARLEKNFFEYAYHIHILYIHSIVLSSRGKCLSGRLNIHMYMLFTMCHVIGIQYVCERADRRGAGSSDRVPDEQQLITRIESIVSYAYTCRNENSLSSFNLSTFIRSDDERLRFLLH